ncbi:MAG: sensor domain-containing diguanylate cyclase [Rubrivivax sp.]|nr:sensor domain-containing diguanylate cyclase [Rubrivivax sp.]
MLDDLVEGSDTRDEALVIVTDLRGVVLAHPDRSRVLKPISDEPRMAQGYLDWVAAGSAIEPAGQFLRQAGQVLSATGIAGPDWVLWRAVPRAELLAPLRAARHKALLTAAAIVAIGLLAVRALISVWRRPLQQLQRRAESLFDDRGDAQDGWPQVGGEIGELSRVLRQVSAERSQFERLNARVLAQLGSVMAAAPVGILFTREQCMQLVSTEMGRLVQRAAPELMQQPLATLFASADDFAQMEVRVVDAFAHRLPYAGEWQLLRADGSTFWAQLRGQPVAATDPAAGTIWTVADVSDAVQARGELEWSATHDPLTGLGNRKLFEQRMEHVMAHRPASLPAAVVMLDLDRFKPINDTAGHATGDAMLQQVAAAISSQVRHADMVARIGGDEFALLLENCPPEAARRIMLNVHEAFAAIRLPWQERQLQVGASLGAALLQADTPNAATWLQQADAACYAAKAAGRGRVRMAPA